MSILQLSGKLAMGLEINELRKGLRALLDQKRRTLVDLGEITGIDSTGIGVLVEAHALAVGSGGALRLCNLSPAMSTQVSRLSLDRILQIYETDTAALAGWI